MPVLTCPCAHTVTVREPAGTLYRCPKCNRHLQVPYRTPSRSPGAGGLAVCGLALLSVLVYYLVRSRQAESAAELLLITAQAALFAVVVLAAAVLALARQSSPRLARRRSPAVIGPKGGSGDCTQVRLAAGPAASDNATPFADPRRPEGTAP